MNKDKKMLLGIGIVFLFLAVFGFSYAYFTAILANKDVKDQIVETGTLSLRYVDGSQIVINNIKPGDTITKTIYVANTGTLDASYNLVWQELVNEIIKKEMIIEATCTRINSTTEEVDGTCENLESTPIGKTRIKENITIEPNIIHKYDITITFKEINADQNYNQGKNFNGVLGIKEYKAPAVVNCTFDGDLVQGAEYVNGQYTYRYMQEGRYSSSTGLSWNNLYTDGWGVILTDTNSTEPVTSKVCTYINDKPVISMSYMFRSSKTESIDLSSFNTSNIINMSAMFYKSSVKELDVSNFDTSNVKNMSYMFSDSIPTILDISNFDTSNVTDMSNIFANSHATILDVSNFNTSKVTNMSYMFSNTQAQILNVSNFDTSTVTNMKYMFYHTKDTSLNLSSFNTSNVINMGGMFSGSQSETLDVSRFDTSKVTDMGSMFKNAKPTVLNLSNFNTSNVIYMNAMFADCTNLKTIYASDKFDISNVTNSSNMFSSTNNLVGGTGTKYDENHIDKEYARIDGGTDSPGYFTLKTN